MHKYHIKHKNSNFDSYTIEASELKYRGRAIILLKHGDIIAAFSIKDFNVIKLNP